jgi:hypothetical protein
MFMFIILQSLILGMGGYTYYLIFESNKIQTKEMVEKLKIQELLNRE